MKLCITFLLGLIFFVGCSFKGVKYDRGVVQTIEGNWEWRNGKDTCNLNPHEISFNKKRTKMYITYGKPILGYNEKQLKKVEYNVHRILKDRVHLTINKETRTDPTGELVEWDLILISDDEYCWYRHDWKKGACTKSNYRCK